MSQFEIECPHCGVALSIQEEWIGMILECPACKKEFSVQGSQEEAPAVSSQENPFDIFISCKVTTPTGARTSDSVAAQTIYYRLVKAGCKVFFDRITLADKPEQQYEEYISAALNSAKIMLVIGSKKEYFEDVHVRNEWGRFLDLMKADPSKMLIPCCKDMPVRNLPQELSQLRSLEINKDGSVPNLLYMINEDEIAPLLKQIENSLSVGDWQAADEYCGKVITIDPELPQVRIYRLLAKHRLSSDAELYKIENLKAEPDFQQALRFSDVTGKQQLNAVLAQQVKIREQEESQRRDESLRQQEAQRRMSIEKLREDAEKLNFQGNPVARITNLLTRFDESADLPELAEIREQFLLRVYNYAVSQKNANPGLVLELLEAIPELPEADNLRRMIISPKQKDQEKQDSRGPRRNILAVGGVFILLAVFLGSMIVIVDPNKVPGWAACDWFVYVERWTGNLTKRLPEGLTKRRTEGLAKRRTEGLAKRRTEDLAKRRTEDLTSRLNVPISSQEAVRILKINDPAATPQLTIIKEINPRNQWFVWVMPTDRRDEVEQVIREMDDIGIIFNQINKLMAESRRLRNLAGEMGSDDYWKSMKLREHGIALIEQAKKLLPQAEQKHKEVQAWLMKESVQYFESIKNAIDSSEMHSKAIKNRLEAISSSNTCTLSNIRGPILLLVYESVNLGYDFTTFQGWFKEYRPFAAETWTLK